MLTNVAHPPSLLADKIAVVAALSANSTTLVALDITELVVIFFICNSLPSLSKAFGNVIVIVPPDLLQIIQLTLSATVYVAFVIVTYPLLKYPCLLSTSFSKVILDVNVLLPKKIEKIYQLHQFV